MPMKNSLILSIIDIPSIKPAIIVDQIEASGMNKSESFNLPNVIGETMACMETKACVHWQMQSREYKINVTG